MAALTPLVLLAACQHEPSAPAATNPPRVHVARVIADLVAHYARIDMDAHCPDAQNVIAVAAP